MDEILARTEAEKPYRRLVRRWLRALTERNLLSCDGSGRYGGAPPADAGSLDRAWVRAQELQRDIDPGATELLTYFRACAEHLPALLRGDLDPLQLLFPDGRFEVARSLYAGTLLNRCSARTLAAAVAEMATLDRHVSPLRVLEVGAGVGGTTADLVAALAGHRVDYLFTDLSQFFVNAAREQFATEPQMRFGVFDLERDAREQGLAPNGFDVVVADDVLHSTRDVAEALARLRELLVPGGWLVFAEMTRDQYQIMVSLELLTRVDEAAGDFVDLRRGHDQTFLTHAQWLDVLAAAGAEPVLTLTTADHPLAKSGMQVLAASFKRDRRRLDRADVLRHLGGQLPESMHPSQLQAVDALPLTVNGKLDREQLRSVARRAHGGLHAGFRRAGGDGVGTSRGRRLVGAARQRVHRARRGFFDLGGDSLLAAQIAGRLLVVPEAAPALFDDLLRKLLEGPTVAELAATLAGGARPGGRHPRARRTGPHVLARPGEKPACIPRRS